MKKLIAAALLGIMTFAFVAAPVALGDVGSAYARGGHDDPPDHDAGDDHGGGR